MTYPKEPNKMHKAENKLFSLIRKSSENKKTIPAKPIKTPVTLRKLIFSSFIKKCAKSVEVNGEVDIKIAAKLLCTFFTP